MSNPSLDIATILEEDGYGMIGKDIYATFDIPPKPDLIALVTTTGATEPDMARIDYSFPIIQVVVRGSLGGYLACSEKMYEIKDHLHGITSRQVNGMRYVYIYVSSPPIDLELDDNRRPKMAATFMSMRSC